MVEAISNTDPVGWGVAGSAWLTPLTSSRFRETTSYSKIKLTPLAGTRSVRTLGVSSRRKQIGPSASKQRNCPVALSTEKAPPMTASGDLSHFPPLWSGERSQRRARGLVNAVLRNRFQEMPPHLRGASQQVILP